MWSGLVTREAGKCHFILTSHFFTQLKIGSSVTKEEEENGY